METDVRAALTETRRAIRAYHEQNNATAAAQRAYTAALTEARQAARSAAMLQRVLEHGGEN